MSDRPDPNSPVGIPRPTDGIADDARRRAARAAWEDTDASTSHVIDDDHPDHPTTVGSGLVQSAFAVFIAAFSGNGIGTLAVLRLPTPGETNSEALFTGIATLGLVAVCALLIAGRALVPLFASLFGRATWTMGLVTFGLFAGLTTSDEVTRRQKPRPELSYAACAALVRPSEVARFTACRAEADRCQVEAIARDNDRATFLACADAKLPEALARPPHDDGAP